MMFGKHKTNMNNNNINETGMLQNLGCTESSIKLTQNGRVERDRLATQIKSIK